MSERIDDEILLGQPLQFDADRQATLQFRQQVARLGDMEGAARDEQDMVGLERTIFGRDGRALDQRQQVALHALAADRAAAHVADRDLVDLVEEHDAVLLGRCDGDAGDIVLIEPLVLLFLEQLVPRVGNAQLAALLRAAGPWPCPSCRRD